MNIVIIDDDIFVSGALKTILEASGDITVSATGTDGKDAVKLFRTYRPDVLLMDIRMKELSGLDASAEILAEFPDAKILLLTTFSDDEYIVRALKLGAKGYLLKQDYESLVPALHAVYSGQTVFGNEIISKIPDCSKLILGLILKTTISVSENWRLSVSLPMVSATKRLPHTFFSVKELFGII
jgi:DNA-binding NarL/FixJ family response regulator